MPSLDSSKKRSLSQFTDGLWNAQKNMDLPRIKAQHEALTNSIVASLSRESLEKLLVDAALKDSTIMTHIITRNSEIHANVSQKQQSVEASIRRSLPSPGTDASLPRTTANRAPHPQYELPKSIPELPRYGGWTLEADRTLLQARAAGMTYDEICENYFPTKGYSSCKTRYRVLKTQPTLKRKIRGGWTPEEDRTLLVARAQGMRFLQISQAYFPSKSRSACEHRHLRLMRGPNPPKRDNPAEFNPEPHGSEQDSAYTSESEESEHSLDSHGRESVDESGVEEEMNHDAEKMEILRTNSEERRWDGHRREVFKCRACRDWKLLFMFPGPNPSTNRQAKSCVNCKYKEWKRYQDKKVLPIEGQSNETQGGDAFDIQSEYDSEEDLQRDLSNRPLSLIGDEEGRKESEGDDGEEEIGEEPRKSPDRREGSAESTIMVAPREFGVSNGSQRKIEQGPIEGALFSCPYGCQYGPWTSHDKISSHVQGYHTNPQVYECDIDSCEGFGPYRTYGSLQRHIRDIHTNPGPHYCSVCGKGPFKLARGLNRHRRKNHPGR